MADAGLQPDRYSRRTEVSAATNPATPAGASVEKAE
jgi:hypothetical protein